MLYSGAVTSKTTNRQKARASFISNTTAKLYKPEMNKLILKRRQKQQQKNNDTNYIYINTKK